MTTDNHAAEGTAVKKLRTKKLGGLGPTFQPDYNQTWTSAYTNASTYRSRDGVGTKYRDPDRLSKLGGLGPTFQSNVDKSIHKRIYGVGTKIRDPDRRSKLDGPGPTFQPDYNPTWRSTYSFASPYRSRDGLGTKNRDPDRRSPHGRAVEL